MFAFVVGPAWLSSFGGSGTVGQPGVFFALFILSEPLRSRRLCVLFFNAEAAEATEFLREFEFRAPRLGRSSRRVRRYWPEIFELMILGLPNKPDGPNRRQPLGLRAPVGEAGVRGLSAAVGHPGR